MVRTLTVVLVLSCAAQVVAQTSGEAPSRLLLFGGVTENANNLPYRSTLLITDRKVSPLFSLGSGRGFEFSVTRLKTRHLAYTADFSGYLERRAAGNMGDKIDREHRLHPMSTGHRPPNGIFVL